MSRSTSPLFKSMANAQETGEVLLALVTIAHTSIVGGPLRVVQDMQNLTSNGNVYTAFPFEIVLPEDTDDGPAKIKLVIDNIDQSLAKAIRSIPPNSPPSVTVEIVVASQPDVVELSIPGLTLRLITGDAFRIEGDLWMDEEDLIPFPEGIVAPNTFPGVFR
jgi:hypothetical protein